jgi:hypothetical protein
MTSITDILNDPHLKDVKQRLVHSYGDTAGFSGIGYTFPAEQDMPGIVVLWFDKIPEDFPTEIDGVPVSAKIVGQIKTQQVERSVHDWDDVIDDLRGLT